MMSFCSYILTPLTEPYFEKEQGFKDYVLSRTPMARWGVPEDFKGITLLLCSPASGYINGARIPIDGGFNGN